MNEILAAKIASAFSETDAHFLRLRRASDKLRPRFPLTEESFRQLGDDVVETLDQFLYRFLNRLYERWGELKTILDNAHRYYSERIEPLLGAGEKG